MKPKYYITTPIYYVNDIPHIGHSYTTIAADILARWKKLQGYDVYFLTGTDEHGMKIAISAANGGITPKEHVDKVVTRFKDAWTKLNIQNDGFIRTTDDIHKLTVQKIFNQLHDNGDIYKGQYEGSYCAPCESYWTDFQLNGSDKCPDCARPVTKVIEEAYFFAISKYQDRLLKYINDNPDFIKPVSRRNEIVNFIESGLKDLNVSRTNFTWGIQAPFDAKHIIYVWFDALINYVSAIGYANDSEEFKKYWPADVHLMGKEIVRFHAVIWPAILMALDLPLPKKVFGHGWWTVEGEKMSKTTGNVVDPIALSEEFGIDTVRYFLMREVPFGSDGDFSKANLIKRFNSDLANDLGNLLSRTLTMIEKYYSGIVPEFKKIELTDIDQKIMALIVDTPKTYSNCMDNIQITDAIACVWELISYSNFYIENKAPWKLAKENKTDELAVVLFNLYEALKVVSNLIAPIMPQTSDAIKVQLGTDGKIQKGSPLFPRIQN